MVLGPSPLILAMTRGQGQSQIDLASADIHWENCGSEDEVVAASSKVLILQELDIIIISIITWGEGAVSLRCKAVHRGTGQMHANPEEQSLNACM